VRPAAACSSRGATLPSNATAPSKLVSARAGVAGSAHKLKTDADYRANQTAAQRRWRERHPEYWRAYRQRHPDATARNREQQRERNRRRAVEGTGRSPPTIANMDAYSPERPVRSGTYRLVPVAAPGVAKMDAYLVEMHVLSYG
jgi:hypothetical protein